MTAFRARGAAASARWPWPTVEDEAWRRTDLSSLGLDACAPGPTAEGPSPGPPPGFEAVVGDAEACLLWSEAGVYRRVPELFEQRGISLLDLGEAARRFPERVFQNLGRVLPPEEGKFAALSAADWTRGLFLHVPPGVDAGVVRGGFGLPLPGGRAAATRSLVLAEAGSRLTLLEDYASSPETSGEALATAGVEIVVGEGAEVTYVNLQRQGRHVNHFLLQGARLARDGRLTTLVLALGGHVSRADFASHLEGAGAASRLYGLIFGEADQRMTHHTFQDHRAPGTTSDLLFKAALLDRARSVYTGMVRIDAAAARSDAYQVSKNVLLSREARADAIPMLEILTDDVKCGHGAAVGSLDDDQRFYLMSRGLSRREAERAIVEGFFEDVLRRVPVPGVRERVKRAIDEKLAGHG